jgi:hypothetical protein
VSNRRRHLDRQSDEIGRTAMAGSVNKVILIGNLGADPEIKFAYRHV